MDTERRRGERRNGGEVVNASRNDQDAAESQDPLVNQRTSGNRRATQDWKHEFRTIQQRVESETNVEDI